jgi:hypothetical protein
MLLILDRAAIPKVAEKYNDSRKCIYVSIIPLKNIRPYRDLIFADIAKLNRDKA